MYLFPLEQLPYYQNYAFREKFFSPEECDRILALLNQYPLADAPAPQDSGQGSAPPPRRSQVAVLPWARELEWIYQRLSAAVLECNKSLYNFQLTGFGDAMQIEKYSPGSTLEWRQDFGNREQSIRKMNIVAHLSDSGQYEGGDLEFFAGRSVQKAVRSRGALLFFPSFVSHRITPVTAGNRYSLVGSALGPPFR